MNNLLETYTRIKLRIGSDIIVSYYSCYGKKNIEKFRLVNISKFDYISVENEEKSICINFFGDDKVIESIKVYGSNYTLYYNPDANKDVFDGLFVKPEFYDIMNKKIFGDKDINFDDKDFRADHYLSRNCDVMYDFLFFSVKQQKEFEMFFDSLISELSTYAIKHGFNPELKRISIGTTSIAYEIGDKIVKIGKPRRCNYIPYCEYLLQPIVCRVFDFDGYPIQIEVTQKVYALENENGYAIYSQDERFENIVTELKKILFNIGLETDDLHAGNVGILLEDNKIHFDGIDFDTGSDLVTSILFNSNYKILKKGRFVIIDLDLLYISDLDKYCNYLSSIGYDDNIITDVKSKYKYLRK